MKNTIHNVVVDQYTPLPEELKKVYELITNYVKWSEEYESNLFSHKDWDSNLIESKINELKEKVLKEVQA